MRQLQKEDNHAAKQSKRAEAAPARQRLDLRRVQQVLRRGCGRLAPLRGRGLRAAAGGDQLLARHGLRQQAAGHAVRGRRIEVIPGEEVRRAALGCDGAVKHQKTAVGILRAEFNVVADHDDRRALLQQTVQDRGQLALDLRVHALCRLVEQQKLRPGQQQLGQRGALLFAAGKIVGMPVQQAFQTAEAGHFLHAPRLLRLRQGGELLPQLIADRGAVKEHLRVLRQKADALGPAEALAAQRAAQTGQQAQRRRLAAAVSAEQGGQLAAGKAAAQVLQHVLTVLFIAEPDVLQAEQLLSGGAEPARRNVCQRVRGGVARQPLPPLRHGHGALVRADGAADAYRRRHGEINGAFCRAQGAADLLRRAMGQNGLLQRQHAVAQRQGLLQPVLTQDDRCAELAADARHGVQEIGGRDGVELGCRLVEQQYARLQRHDGGQIQKLLLPAGQSLYRAGEPLFNAEKARHLRHAAADDRRGKAEALHTEGQLVPYAVRDDLVVRLLQHKADLGGLPPRVQRGKRLAEEGNISRKAAVRRQRGLQRAQQRRFTAAGRADDREEFALLHGKRDVAQGGNRLLRIGKAQMRDRDARHWIASFASKIRGNAASRTKAAVQTAACTPAAPPGAG